MHEGQFKQQDGVQVVRAGCFAYAENVVLSKKRFYGAKDGEVLVGVADLPFVLLGGDRHGCCGPIGQHGFNLFCPDDHPVGTECGDCWMPHYVHMPLTHVEVCPA